MRKKRHFLETFLMIKDHEIDHPLSIAQNFFNSLKENRGEDYFIETVQGEKIIAKAKFLESKKNQSRAFKAKRANFTGVNMLIFWNLVFTFIYLGIFALFFTLILIIFITNQASIDNARKRITDTKIIFFEYGVLYTAIYEYITEDDTTLLFNQPIGQEWENIYSDLTEANSFLTKFIEKGQVYNDEIELILSGDLCPVYFKTRVNCYTENSGVASKGVLAINAYMSKLLRSVKDFYDSSNKTFQAKNETLVLTDMLQVELIYELNSKPIYAALDQVLQDKFQTIINNFTKGETVLTVFAAIAFILSTKYIWFKLHNRMHEERTNLRNMLRLVPISIVTSNRFIKNYLLSNSRKILDSVKNIM